jgi:heterodisulfide reductase subunit A
MENNGNSTSVLVIGAGIAGIESSLLLANSGAKVYLVEKASYFGGNVTNLKRGSARERLFTSPAPELCLMLPLLIPKTVCASKEKIANFARKHACSRLLTILSRMKNSSLRLELS